MKVYDPILCMLVEKSTRDAENTVNLLKQRIQSVYTNRDYEHVANQIIREYMDKKTITREQKNQLLEMLQKKRIKGVNDRRTVDSTRGREVGKYVNEIFHEMGINNSIGKYDKVLFGVKHILGESLLQGEDLKKAVRRETERLLKKYGAKDANKGTSKGYELDGYWIKDNGYGFTISKNGRKVHECESEDEAERWIRNQYED